MISVDQFHEKYGVLPSVLDPRWKRELERSKVLSKMQVVDIPMLNPGKCVECGASANDRKYVDLGVDLDPSDDPRFSIAVYLCIYCIRELVYVAFQNDLDPTTNIKEILDHKKEDTVAKPDAVAEMAVPMELSQIEGKLDDILSFIRGNSVPTDTSGTPVSSTTEVAGQAPVAKSRPAESTASRRSKGVPSLDELLKESKRGIPK